MEAVSGAKWALVDFRQWVSDLIFINFEYLSLLISSKTMQNHTTQFTTVIQLHNNYISANSPSQCDWNPCASHASWLWSVRVKGSVNTKLPFRARSMELHTHTESDFWKTLFPQCEASVQAYYSQLKMNVLLLLIFKIRQQGNEFHCGIFICIVIIRCFYCPDPNLLPFCSWHISPLLGPPKS